MAKITGLGGAFLKAKDPKALYAWYEQHLGIQQAPYGSFVFEKADGPDAPTVLAFFPESSDSFGASGKGARLNFTVDDLDGLLDAMAAAGVEVDAKREKSEYGNFGWFTDPEGNRVELWEPPAESE